MKLGVCYYPEHWPEERWDTDARLMREAGLSIVRIGEFAWSKMEPRERQFDWAWLDKAIDILGKAGLQVVLGTPTATPPAWLVRAHPEILPVDARGQRREFGSRRHYCTNSPVYREYTQRIVQALAERYGQHPAVIGWQVDNEFGCHDTTRCYCLVCADAFRGWLRGRYETLEALNRAWGTVFWSQTYGDWDEIEPPNLTVTEPNPSQVLDYERFASDSVVAYQQIQVDILREKSSGKFVTTNLMGGFTDIDYHDLSRSLDFVSWDSYPTGHAETLGSAFYAPWETQAEFPYDTGDPYVTGFGHDLARGTRQAPFWVMEQQCGHINWGRFNPGIRLGTVRLWTWHAAASGAEAVVYFRWRATLFAQEQMHSGLLNHDASPAVGYQDIRAMQAERDLLDAISAQPYRAQAAMLLDFDDLWAMKLQPHREGFDYWRHLFVYYRAFQRCGCSVDLVSGDTDLSRYRLLIVPSAYIVDEERANALRRYVENGGTLLTGVRSGYKTRSNLVTDQPLPGVLRKLTGVTVSTWHALPPHIAYPVESVYESLSGAATIWAEALKPDLGEDVRALARYGEGPFQGSAAFTEHPVGRGVCYTLGYYPHIDQAQAVVKFLTYQARIKDLVDLPEGLLRIQRGPYTVMLNFTDEPFLIELYGQERTVQPRDLAVFQKDSYDEF